MNDRIIIFIFSFFIFGIISSLSFGFVFQDYKNEIEFKKKILRGDCVVIDQFNRCYSAEEYQNYLNIGKDILKDVPKEFLENEKNIDESFIKGFKLF